MTTEPSAKPSFWKRVWFAVRWIEIRFRFVAILLLTALVVGYWDNLQNHYERYLRHRQGVTAGAVASAPVSAEEFFCPMHQFVVRERPGKCPICGMDLSRRMKGAAVELPAGVLARVQASPERIMQAGVAVEPVTLHMLVRTVRAYGSIETDETRLARITARFPGRIEELRVNAVGETVQTGQPLARIYSPKFLAATQEYLQALASQRQAQADANASSEDKQRAAKIAEFARGRLSLAGFTAAQLDAMAVTGKADLEVTLNSPLAGTVLEKNVLTGQTVEEGTVLYTIADLTSLWVQAQVLESGLAAVTVGMPVEVTTPAFPGRIFYGNVNFIAPVLSTETRSMKVRIVVDNRAGELKPGMAVNAVFRAPFGAWGPYQETATADVKANANTLAEPVVAAPAADAYTCPMHPEVISDKPGDCPKCGMHLVKKKTEVSAVAAAPGTEVYTCPMDPEVISEKPGDCPKCGMHLVKKKAAPAPAGDPKWAVGYACAMHPQELQAEPGVCTTCGCGMKLEKIRIQRVLAVPESAVIDTGTRQVVYVESQPGLFDARAVTLGSRCDTWYPVLAGLADGDRVVTRGSFLIDAEARLNPVTATPGK